MSEGSTCVIGGFISVVLSHTTHLTPNSAESGGCLRFNLWRFSTQCTCLTLIRQQQQVWCVGKCTWHLYILFCGSASPLSWGKLSVEGKWDYTRSEFYINHLGHVHKKEMVFAFVEDIDFGSFIDCDDFCLFELLKDVSFFVFFVVDHLLDVPCSCSLLKYACIWIGVWKEITQAKAQQWIKLI